jgi:perosamine synthetase
MQSIPDSVIGLALGRMLNANNSGYLTEGVNVLEFEELFSKWSGQVSIACNSAGTGLFTLAKCYNVQNCIVPNNTFYATGAMIQAAGGTVHLCDVNKDTLNVSLSNFQETYYRIPIGKHVDFDCVVLPHIGGIVNSEYQSIVDWCRSEGLTLLEDCAHATGAVCQQTGLIAGSLGDGGVYSFYPTKAVPIGEGGMIVLSPSNHKAIEFCRRYRNYGKYTHDGVLKYSEGFNFRMDEWTASVGCVQMARIQDIMGARKSDADRLKALGFEPVLESSNWYKYVVVKSSLPRNIKKTTGHIYQYTDQLAQSLGLGGQYPHCAYIANNYVCLPVGEGMYSTMTDNNIINYLQGGSWI